MSRRIGLPVKVKRNAAGEPVSFTWRGEAESEAGLIPRS